MKDLQQPKIISYGSNGNRGRYDLITLPPADHISYTQEMVGMQYGWVKIISPEKRWSQNWNHCRVLTQCMSCGQIQWTLLNNLQRGISKGCQKCSQPRQIPLWLDRRLTAAKQRCENSKDAAYKNYGERGIRFNFHSVLEAGLWIIENLGLPNMDLEIDRIDNNGHYERGNIRFVTRKENCSNRRITVISNWNPIEWPYARTVVTRKLSQGMLKEEIIEDARKAVKEKRRNWKIIDAKLDFMTY